MCWDRTSSSCRAQAQRLIKQVLGWVTKIQHGERDFWPLLAPSWLRGELWQASLPADLAAFPKAAHWCRRLKVQRAPEGDLKASKSFHEKREQRRKGVGKRNRKFFSMQNVQPSETPNIRLFPHFLHIRNEPHFQHKQAWGAPLCCIDSGPLINYRG